jgi:hypothetical protein
MNFREEMKLFVAKVLVLFVAAGVFAVGVVSTAAAVVSFSKTFDTK